MVHHLVFLVPQLTCKLQQTFCNDIISEPSRSQWHHHTYSVRVKSTDEFLPIFLSKDKTCETKSRTKSLGTRLRTTENFTYLWSGCCGDRWSCTEAWSGTESWGRLERWLLKRYDHWTCGGQLLKGDERELEDNGHTHRLHMCSPSTHIHKPPHTPLHIHTTTYGIFTLNSHTHTNTFTPSTHTITHSHTLYSHTPSHTCTCEAEESNACSR